MRQAPPAILLSGVTRVFGVSPGIVRADLRVERGETVLLRGPNGAGKSTLLRVIATVLSPTFGTGAVLGFDLVSGREEIRRRVEFLGHRTRLYDDMTASENLRFACRLFGLDQAAVPLALDHVGLGRVGDQRVRSFSHGMRQRLAVARVLLRSPDLLLLDEPYAGLDSAAKDVVDEGIVSAREAGRTVILATHDWARAGMANRTLFMEGGRLLPELQSSPAVKAPSGGGDGP